MTQYCCRSFQAEVIVLKFGSSILESLVSFKYAALEVKRFVVEGYKVIAIVSAIGNTTDSLEDSQRASYRNNSQISAKAHALLLSTGELQSVSYLTETLLQHNIQSDFIINPIFSEGDYVNATPISINEALFNELLSAKQAIVVPGFVAQNNSNEVCLLGRGGSDLTALFITYQMQAKRCILLKDVDGVYHLDPNKFKNAIRYETLTYDCAKDKANQVIQPQALLWAKAHRLTFQIGKLDSNNYTTVGTLKTKAATKVQVKIKEVS